MGEAVMVEVGIDDTELLMAVDALKQVSGEEREAAILALEEKHPGIRDSIVALLALEEPKVSKKKFVKLIQRYGVWWQTDGKRWLGPPPKLTNSNAVGTPQLKVVDQAKPEPEPEPEKTKPERGALAVIPPAPAVGDWDDVLAAMNRQHAIIENVGGKAVIASWEPSTYQPDRLMVIFQNKDSFLLRYSNRFIPLEVAHGRIGVTAMVKVPLGQWWLGHRDRQQYRGITFRPDGPTVISECLNLWQGWGIEPKPGNWDLIKEHIYNVVAGGNK